MAEVNVSAFYSLVFQWLNGIFFMLLFMNGEGNISTLNSIDT